MSVSIGLFTLAALVTLPELLAVVEFILSVLFTGSGRGSLSKSCYFVRAISSCRLAYRGGASVASVLIFVHHSFETII
jgi:hypothetical protein